MAELHSPNAAGATQSPDGAVASEAPDAAGAPGATNAPAAVTTGAIATEAAVTEAVLTEAVLTEAILTEAIVTLEEFERRVITPSQFVADTEAFVDVRLAGSQGKASYSLIGPGVSQNADQTVNLAVPHGFHVGAATMPAGTVNNPHMHFTAEVFICTRGRWRMRLGRHGDQVVDLTEGGVFSVPTWVFRGFENIGGDDGWLFTVLGGDDTGGIIWSPETIRAAAETGMYLSEDGKVIDSSLGERSDHVVGPFDDASLELLDCYTDTEIERRLVAHHNLEWSSKALLGSVANADANTNSNTDTNDHADINATSNSNGDGCEVAPVIGYGITEDRHQRAPISTPHGFSLDWLRVYPGARTGLHRIGRPQVLMLYEGRWEVTLNRGRHRISREIPTGSVVSIPPGAWRDFRNVGSNEALAVVVCGSDSPARLQWDQEVIDKAAKAGWALDAGGYLAPLRLLEAPTLAFGVNDFGHEPPTGAARPSDVQDKTPEEVQAQ